MVDDYHFWLLKEPKQDPNEGQGYLGVYNPTINTVEGRSQAWGLMDKLQPHMEIFEDETIIYGHSYNDNIRHKDPLIAVTIAFILARQGEE